MDIKMIDLDKADSSTSDSPKENSPAPSFVTEKKPQSRKKFPFLTVIIFLVVAVGGFYTGAWLKSRQASSGGSAGIAGIQEAVPEDGAKVGDIYGSADEKTFKDSATGVLDKGGFNGEGTHKLVRAGGVSQTVYLTSSTIDLDALVGHQVSVWGETFKGQKVGWLMDVGRAKVEALNAPLPK